MANIQYGAIPNINQNNNTDYDMAVAANNLKQLCESRSTCEGCNYCLDKLGCYFRYHSPREYNV